MLIQGRLFLSVSILIRFSLFSMEVLVLISSRAHLLVSQFKYILIIRTVQVISACMIIICIIAIVHI